MKSPTGYWSDYFFDALIREQIKEMDFIFKRFWQGRPKDKPLVIYFSNPSPDSWVKAMLTRNDPDPCPHCGINRIYFGCWCDRPEKEA